MLSALPIRKKLLVGLSALALALLGILAALHISVRNSDATMQALLKDRVVPLKDIKIVADSYAVDIVDAAHKARNGNMTLAEAAQAVSAGQEKVRSHWLAYEDSALAGDEAKLAQNARRQMERANGDVQRLERILRNGDRRELDAFVVTRLYAAIDPVSADLAKLIDEQIRASTELAQASSRVNDIVFWISLALTLGAAMAWFFAAHVAQTSVSKPMSALADTMSKLAGGAQVSVPFQQQKDEIGQMARACEVFRASADARAEADVKAATLQRQVTAELRRAIDALASGDLTSELPESFPSEFAEIRVAFNGALAALRQVIDQVADSASSISTGSSEISQAADDLARRTERNAASLEESSTAISGVDARLRASTESALTAVKLAGDAFEAVSRGRGMANDAHSAMNRMAERAKGIDNIIDAMDKIAFQTRVLAMNAAVEAGRAGEVGRGFAVVADLVSALAMRAEEEAQAARDQLVATQTELFAARTVVEAVSESFTTINGNVDHVRLQIEQIAKDNQSQSSAISQVFATVSSMDRDMQQNAAMVEETSAATRNLLRQVSTLSEQASRFDTGAGDQATSNLAWISDAARAA